MISNSIIEPGAKVYNNSIIANTFLGSGATVLNCGSITFDDTKEWKDLMIVELGPESGGGRPVTVLPECTLVDVCSSLSIGIGIGIGIGGRNLNDNDAHANANAHAPKQAQDLSEPTRIHTHNPIVISSNIILGDILHTNSASNIYISHKASIHSSSVHSAILLPQSTIQNSTAHSVFLQWNSSIVQNSNVSSSLLMECSEMGPNSVVSSTILGPDSHVSCGEVHCSLLGPNTNSHHQSLLISTLWPTGRGNVGYGTNCGSNHTGRIPDQECAVGEGIFWGLGCVIKFPVDLSKAFYSVVAAGVQLPPQSVAMPFSLIMAGSGSGSGSGDIAGDIAAGMNEIVPGWLLHSSPYTILRSEEKFKNRRKAKRHDFYCGWNIIRPSTVDSCRRVRNLLLSVKSWSMTATTTSNTSNMGTAAGQSSDSNSTAATTTFFTEKDMIQLGKNYMTTRGLNVGIDAYTNMIQRYALEGLFEQFNGGASFDAIEQAYLNAATAAGGFSAEPKAEEIEIAWPILPWEEESHNSASKLLEHKLQVLSLELSSIVIVNHADPSKIKMPFAEVCIKCFKKFIEIESHHAKQVLRSKQRDDKRGRQTIPGYADSHVQAEHDPVVLLAQRRSKEVVSKCNDFILQLSSEIISKL
jgi:hypothetical protein